MTGNSLHMSKQTLYTDQILNAHDIIYITSKV